MNRRQFLYAVGGVSGASGVAIGTGAFSRVEANRDVRVTVADDGSALLGLDRCDDSPNAGYARVEDGILALDLTPDNRTDAGGQGVNANASTFVHRVFQVCNQGTQDVCLWIEDHDDWPTVDGTDRRVDCYLEDDPDRSLVGADQTVTLPVGECVCVGLAIDTTGYDADETLLSQLDDRIVIHAAEAADAGTGTGTAGESADDEHDEDDEVDPDDPLVATDLTDDAVTPTDLAESLVAGDDVEIVEESVTFVGDERAGGTFEGGTGVLGIEDGIVLSSGAVTDVEGPNESPDTSTSFGTPGDEQLSELAGGETFDAAILEFEFTVAEDTETIGFSYVFGSEEYNEFVGSEFNDVFGLFLNGENVATVPDPDDPDGTLPAAINTINNGQPGIEPTNPGLYVNNDPFDPDETGEVVPIDEVLDTEMDGFTVVLDAVGPVDPESTNTLRFAIADVADAILDSWVLVEGASLEADPDPDPVPDPDPC